MDVSDFKTSCNSTVHSMHNITEYK